MQSEIPVSVVVGEFQVLLHTENADPLVLPTSWKEYAEFAGVNEEDLSCVAAARIFYPGVLLWGLGVEAEEGLLSKDVATKLGTFYRGRSHCEIRLIFKS